MSLLFETSPNTKHKEKNMGGVVYYIPTVWKKWGTRPPGPPPKCANGCRSSQGRNTPKFFSPPLEKCVGHSLNIWTLPDNSSPLWCRKLVTGLVLIKMKTERSQQC